MDQQGTENAIALAPETAADEKGLTPAKKSKRVTRHVVYHRRRSPEERDWMVWNHDVDTILHEMVKSPACLKMSPKKLVERAAAFADALQDLQKKRKPKGAHYNGRQF